MSVSSRKLRTLAAASIAAFTLLGGSVAQAAPATAATVVTGQPDVAFTKIGVTTGENCRDIGVIIPLSADAPVANYVPKDLKLMTPKAVLTEMSYCKSGSINGKKIGYYALAEAAIYLANDTDIPTTKTPLGAEAIYVLSQLDTHKGLSAHKARAGYPTQLVDEVKFSFGDGVARKVVGEVGGTLTPFKIEATITPALIPAGALPIGPLTQQWHGERNARIVTANEIAPFGEAAGGFATVTVPAGSLLAKIFGKTVVKGIAFSGSATFFSNTTYRVTY